MTQKVRPDVTQSLPALQRDISTVKVHEWSVEVVAGPDKGQTLKTLQSLVRIGTEGLNDLVLSDPTVSRRHVEIERTTRGFVVRDLGSRNGVFLDGHQVLQAIVLPGGKLLVGKTRLAVKQEARATELEVTSDDRFGELFGTSEAMRSAFALLRRVAREDLSLLIEGETGTGKELAARGVHHQSSRRHGPFQVVDCTRLEEDDIQQAFEGARGGTLFLDEVGELSASLQPKLLRLLEAEEVDLRVIASTARNLDEEVRHERFRKDLYFRLAVARVRLPPLRARKEELPQLALHLVEHLGSKVELSPQTLSLFEGYDWPGNVRELRNVLERGALMQDVGSSQWLDFLATPEDGGAPTRRAGVEVADVLVALPYHQARDRVLGDFERVYFAEVMRKAGFDIKLAEDMTGLSMQSLYRLLKKNGLRLKDLKNAEGLDR